MAGSQRGANRRREGEITKQRIMDVAQGLFVKRGIDGVSLNEICRVCKVNSAAVNYHFGTKDGLVIELLRRGVDAWGPRRNALTARLEAATHVSLEEVVDAMVVPTLELFDEPWGRSYLQFFTAAASHPAYRERSGALTDPYTTRYVELLKRVLPDVPAPLLMWRYTISRVTLYQALSVDEGINSWFEAHGVPEPQKLRLDFVAYFSGALSAPLASAELATLTTTWTKGEGP